eukprot:g7046.t1
MEDVQGQHPAEAEAGKVASLVTICVPPGMWESFSAAWSAVCTHLGAEMLARAAGSVPRAPAGYDESKAFVAASKLDYTPFVAGRVREVHAIVQRILLNLAAYMVDDDDFDALPAAQRRAMLDWLRRWDTADCAELTLPRPTATLPFPLWVARRTGQVRRTVDLPRGVGGRLQPVDDALMHTVLLPPLSEAQRRPTPPGCVDILADHPGSDGSHAQFDAPRQAAFMPPALRPFVTPDDYESVIAEVNDIIQKRTASEKCCPPKCGLICKWICLIVSCFAAFDYLVADSYKKLDPAKEVVRRWEAPPFPGRQGGISVRFYPGVGLGPPRGSVNTIRIRFAQGSLPVQPAAVMQPVQMQQAQIVPVTMMRA